MPELGCQSCEIRIKPGIQPKADQKLFQLTRVLPGEIGRSRHSGEQPKAQARRDQACNIPRARGRGGAVFQGSAVLFLSPISVFVEKPGATRRLLHDLAAVDSPNVLGRCTL